jgi:uncharacterized protein (TIGR02271 family)
MNALALAGMPTDRIALLSGKAVAGKMFPVEIPGMGPVAVNGKMRDLLSITAPGGGGMRGALLSLGVSPREIEQCAEEVRRGGTLEAVIVDDGKVADANSILNRYADGLDQQATEIVVPVIREELEVGTREIDAGGIRIASHVREIPVEQTVTVREERVTVERRIIDRPIAEGDDAFRDRTLDLRATAEEPVITKRAHVVEEVRVHKDRDEKIAKVNETLRHTDVTLSDLPSERTFDASRFRDHFNKYYGDRYDLKTLAPAYEFGERLSRSTGGGDWTRVEANARVAWERSNPGTWDRFKEAILAGWKMRQ